MLFRKNKPDQPQSPNPSVQGQSASPGMTEGASSVFAPGLQARSAPIDFGFDSVPPPPQPQSYIVPAPPPDMFSQPEVPPAQADWNAGLLDDAQALFTQSALPAQESWEIQQPVAEPTYTSPEQAWGQSIIQESGNTAYLGETFESYVAQEPDFGLEAANAWQPPQVPESGFHAQTEYQTVEPILSFDDSAAFSATLDQMSPMPELTPPLGLESGDSMLGFGEPSTGMETPAYTSDFTVTTGEAMPWDQPQGYEPPVVEYQSSVQALHNNLTAGNALPGEQVSVSPGALLDSMHQQFYPEDPFGMDQGDVMEGQQAFEEAAQFLFPDTVSASLDWQPEETEITTDYSSLSDFQMPVEPGFAPAPMDLGPSVQQSTSDMSDISGLYAGGMPPVTPSAPMADQFSGLAPEPLEPAFDAGTFATGFESDPFSPDAFSLESASFTEQPGSTLCPSDMTLPAADASFSASDQAMSPPAHSADEFSTAFFPETTSAGTGYDYPLAGFESVAPPEFSVPEMNIPVHDLSMAENWQPTIENSTNFAEGAALTNPMMPELAIEAVPLDPFGDMESVHWDPVVAQQAEMMESIASVETPQPGLQMPSLEYNPQDDWMAGQTDSGTPTFVPEESLESSPMASNPTLEPVDEMAFFSQSVQSEVSFIQPVSDQDFYATEFTLDEFGELVPVRETPIESAALPDMDMSAPVLESFEIEPSFPSLDLNGPVSEPHFNQSPAFEMPAPLPDTAELFPSNSEPTLFEAVPAESFFNHPSEAMAAFPAIQPENQMVEDFVPAEAMEPMPPSAPPVSPFMQVVAPPLTAPNVLPQNNSLPPAAGFAPSVPPVQEPEHAPGSLEAQWHEPAETPAASTTQAGTVTPPAAFTLGNLEVLSVCPLAADRRLLVVHSNGVFALMGQVGLEQPQISVLKVFDNNPLAYQNTFTAVAEAQAAAQGMFVTQVGTWHAIVSTFQDKITLHTELG